MTRAPAHEAPLVLAITGASGAPYGIRLLEQLLVAERRISLIVSSHGFRLLATESEVKDQAGLRAAVGARRFDRFVTVFDDGDRGAAPASGSSLAGGMVICPCSMGTLASIAAGTSRSLVERAADVALKERRPLLMVTRETPLSLIHLENMRRVTLAGAVVMPAAPGFYHRPERVSDLVDFIVARVLDHLGVPNTLAPRWGNAEG
ncbi:MAG: UbiX family flavin prenyltransferase [Gemmatimonadota bacterium]|nr:UbiX family flavin prenyltransferase [Gemmatimonadota bacterium]